jgi:succinate dehydrogenase / fumarate reductase flavoprotein subunit
VKLTSQITEQQIGSFCIDARFADGYFVLPYTIADYLSADIRTGAIPTNSAAFDEAEKGIKDKVDFFLNNKGTHSVDHFHKQLGNIMWNKVGMGRTPEGLAEAIKEIEEVRNDFWKM